MALSPGTRLGPYEIVTSIGAGGMGEVFRARDTKRNRDVAMKVLPAAFADDPERLARFTREAQTLASLNHPNIAAIYGIEEVPAVSGPTGPGTRALVMELVEGEDLSTHIARGPIPIAEALPIARQIAEALEAAHEQGIVHRDLKPANIKVRADGTVKVLDFGLAKAMDPAGASSSNPIVSHSPTLTHQGTMAGMIIGTAAYMSPEQAKGKTVDRRADIWAFGVVLCEMMSGQRLFKGEDVSDTLAAVLRQDVDLSALPEDAPPPVRRLVARCLDRDLKRRLRDIGEARVLLENPASPLVSDSPLVVAAPAPRAPLWRRALPWAAAVVVGAALSAVPLMWARSKVKPAYDQQIRFSIQTPDTLGDLPAISAAPVISPDGRFVVFPSPPALGKPPVLWLRPMGALEAQPLPGTEEANWPFWSPDSRHVGFAASGKLKKIDISGGPPQNLCDVVGRFSGGTWNREGVLVFSEGGRLFRVSDAGGPRSDLGSSEQTGSGFYPRFLPDGRHFIYSTLPLGVRREHHLALGQEQQLTRGRRPVGVRAAFRGDPPFAAGAGRRTDVDLVAAGLGRLVRDPSAVRRERRMELHRRRAQEDAGFARQEIPARVAFHGQDHQIVTRSAAVGGEGEGLAVRMPRASTLVFRAVGQPRDLAAAVGVHPVQIADAGLGAGSATRSARKSRDSGRQPAYGVLLTTTRTISIPTASGSRSPGPQRRAKAAFRTRSCSSSTSAST